jgi:hypothetical protein
MKKNRFLNVEYIENISVYLSLERNNNSQKRKDDIISRILKYRTL